MKRKYLYNVMKRKYLYRNVLFLSATKHFFLIKKINKKENGIKKKHDYNFSIYKKKRKI